jgi:GNAT superfamily N-acetyltransferase
VSIPFSIRASTPDDVISIAGLLTQLNRIEGKPEHVDMEALAQGLFAPARKVDVRALVAERAQKVIAVALYYPGYDILTSAYGYHLGDIVVEETQRRTGIGRLLFAALGAQNLAEGGEWISLTVLSRNAAAQGFYAMLGMTHVPVEFFAVGKSALTKLVQTVMK